MKRILIVLLILLTYVCNAQEQRPREHDHHHHDEHEDDDDGCLPIDLLNFDGNGTRNSVNLYWATASETDNDYYMIYHSSNGYEYQILNDHIGAIGNSNITNYYTYTDINPYIGINYYVLVQTDINGSRNFYPPIAVKYMPPNQIPSIWNQYNFLGQEIK